MSNKNFLKTGKAELGKPEIQQLIGENELFKHENVLNFILRATAKRSVGLLRIDGRRIG